MWCWIGVGSLPGSWLWDCGGKHSVFCFRDRRRETGRERNINVWLCLTHPLRGTWPATQACALTGNETGYPLVRRPVLNPLSHTSWGHIQSFNVNNIICCDVHSSVFGRCFLIRLRKLPLRPPFFFWISCWILPNDFPSLVYVMEHADWFSNSPQTMHYWHEPHLVVVRYSLYMLRDWVCWSLLRIPFVGACGFLTLSHLTLYWDKTGLIKSVTCVPAFSIF